MATASSLEYALLGLLRQKAQSGYDLRRVFATTPMRHFSDSPGSIYPALHRLEARRWVISSREDGNARKRHQFALTSAGTRALINWLQSPVTRQDVIWHLDQVMLRFAFLDGNVERHIALRFLEAFETELVAYVRELRKHARTFSPPLRTTTGYLAFTFGVESYQANLVWTRRVRRQFKEALQ